MHSILLMAMVLVGGMTPHPARAYVAPSQFAAKLSRQDPGGDQTNTFELKVDPKSIDNFGYHPLRIYLEVAAPTNNDRSVEMHFVTSSMYGPGPNIETLSRFTLPAGDTELVKKVTLPSYRRGATISWDFLIDGKLVPELSVARTAGPRGNPHGVNMVVNFTGSGLPFQLPENPYLYLLSSQPKSRAGVRRLSRMLNSTDAVADAYDISYIDSLLTRHFSVDDFPDDWIDYSPWDVAVLELDDLEQMANDAPQKLIALTRWIRAGGQFWVCNLGSDPKSLSKIESLLPAKIDSEWYESHLPATRDEPSNSNPSSEVAAATDPGDSQPNAEETDEQPKGPGSGDWFHVADFGLGNIIAFQSSWPDTPPEFLYPRYRPWLTRHGLKPDEQTPQFANWLIPGIGLAPINAFRLLITGFVLAIGPLNYFLLKRAHRLYLMVITVPLSAILTTLAVFAYALLADGLGASARTRSLTFLDQRSGEVATWARSSLYSSLAPASGLTLPDDVTIYPIQASSNEEQQAQGRSMTRTLVWSDDRQQLASNWIHSRTPTQYLSVGARSTSKKLSILQSANRPIRIVNQLDCHIQQLIVIDALQGYHVGESIPEKGEIELKSVDRSSAIRPLLAIVNENQPTFPLGLSAKTATSSVSITEAVIQRRRRRVGPRSADLAGIGLMDNILEVGIRDVVGISGGESVELQPRTYVAVTATAPEVFSGLPAARERGSFHITVGRW